MAYAGAKETHGMSEQPQPEYVDVFIDFVPNVLKVEEGREKVRQSMRE